MAWSSDGSANSSEPKDKFPIKENLPEELKNQGGKVRVREHGDEFRVRFKKPFSSEYLGRCDRYYFDYWEKAKLFRIFLDKFGKRLRFEDAMDNFFLDDYWTRWEIDFQGLLVACTLIKRSSEEFEGVLEKAKTGDQFIIMAGIS